jgi:CTP-dependent riboflavin kinase
LFLEFDGEFVLEFDHLEESGILLEGFHVEGVGEGEVFVFVEEDE